MTTKLEPYVGPRPFEEKERDFFFGRKLETNDLISLVTAHPIVLLYAQSGAGKTSLLKASLIPKLIKEEQFEVLPPARVQGQIPATFPPEQIKNIYMFNALVNLSDTQGEQAALAQTTLAEFLAQWRGQLTDPQRAHVPLVVVFDQFEELFTNYPERWEDRRDFFVQVGAALEADPLLRVVFAMREDYIAELDPYSDIPPEKLRTRFRMERLRRKAALAAVTGPLERLRKKAAGEEDEEEESSADAETSDIEVRRFAPGVAEALVDNLLQIRVDGPEGRKIVYGEFVEPVQLQVVCQTLWKKLTPADEVITFGHLEAFGDINKALTEFYVQALQKAAAETGMTEGVLRAWFDRVMITTEGTRSTVFQGRTETAGLPNKVVQILTRERLLRSESRDNQLWYELSQDRFIQPIQESYKAWLLEQPEERTRLRLEEQAAKWVLSRRKDDKLLLDQGDLALAHRLSDTEGSSVAASQNLLLLVQASENAFEKKGREQERILAQERQRRTESERARAEEQAAARQRDAEQAQALFVEQKRLAETERARAAEEERRIQAELQKAKEAQLRADVERKRAEEQAIAQQREAEQAQALAAEQTRATRRFSRLAVALGILFVLSVVATVFAFQQQSKATANALAATANARAARAAESEARRETARANEQAQAAEAAQLVARNESERANDQAKLALQQKNEADLQRQRAIVASQLAEKRKTLAETETVRANEEKKKAEAASTLAQEQKVLAEQARDAAKTAETRATSEAERANTEAKAAKAARAKAEKQSEISASRELAASAISQLTKDPELSLLLSIEAVQKKKLIAEPTEEAVDALRQSLIESHARAVQQLPSALSGNAIFNADGKSVLFVDGTGTVKKWVVNEGGAPRELLTFLETGVPTGKLSFVSKDNSYLVTYTKDAAQVWRVRDKRLVMSTKPGAHVRSAALSPGNKYLAVAYEDKTAHIFDLETEEPISVLPNHGGPVNSVAFSPDNKRVVTASDDKTIRVWDVQKDVPGVDSLPLIKLGGHEGAVNSAAFSPDGKYIVTASDDRTARLWRTDQETAPESAWQTAFQLLGHEGPVDSAAFSSDSKYVVTASDDGTARVWDVTTGRSIAVLRGHQDAVYNAAFSPNGRSVVTSGRDNTARLWRIGESTEATVLLAGHTETVYAIAYSPDGNLAVTASFDKTARVWDAHTGQLLVVFDKHTAPVVDAAFSPDSRLVATASDDKTARVWEARTGRLISTLEGSEEKLTQVAFSADSKSVLTVNIFGAARLWDVASGQSIALKSPEEMFMTSEKGDFKIAKSTQVAISPDGALVAVSFYLTDKRGIATKQGVRIWDTRSKQVVTELPEQGSQISDIAFSPNNQELITVLTRDVGHIEFVIRPWEIKTGRLLAEVIDKDNTPDVLFSPDGKMFLTTYGGQDRIVRVWDAKTGLNLSTLGHSGTITSAVFSPDSKLVLTASEDGLVRVWDAASGRMMLEIRNEQTIKLTKAVFSPDGSSILTAGSDAKARIYNCEFCGSLPSLLERAQKQKTRDLSDKEKQKYLPPLPVE